MSRRRNIKNRTDSDDPIDLDCRIFVGNLPTRNMSREEMEEIFSKYGKISALTLFHGYGFVQYECEEDANCAVASENGRRFKGYRLDINKAAERRNMNKAPARHSPSQRDLYEFDDTQDTRRDRSPLRASPRRDSREPRSNRDSRSREPREGLEHRDSREARDLRESHSSRDVRDSRGLRDARDARDLRDPRDSRELREPRDPRDLRDPRDVRLRELQSPLYDRYRDARDPRESLYRYEDILEKYRLEEFYRKKEDYFDRYRDPLDRPSDDRLKREERRREELYRQYFEELQRRVDAERPVDCSVVVINKQSKEYAESVGRKVRDLGIMVDLIFLNTEVSLTQALEDVTRGGSPFAIVVTQQHQAHRSCTVNILFGTPQEHRNMPLADAMVLVARHYERFKSETREKEREDIARQAAKMSAETILKERSASAEEGARGSQPPGIMTLLGLIADNRFVTADEIDKVILYLRERKERLLAMTADPLSSQHPRPSLGPTSAPILDGSSTSQTLQMPQQLSSTTSAAQGVNNSQQELQAKILSLFNSGASNVPANQNPPGSATSSIGAASQSYGSMNSNPQRASVQMDTAALGPIPQRQQSTLSQLPSTLGSGDNARGAASRPAPSTQMQGLYGQVSNRTQAAGGGASQRPGSSIDINFNNPSVQKALDTLIQSGPTFSHLVSQAAGQAVRSGPAQQSSMAAYPPRHY